MPAGRHARSGSESAGLGGVHGTRTVVERDEVERENRDAGERNARDTQNTQTRDEGCQKMPPSEGRQLVFIGVGFYIISQHTWVSAAST